MSTTERPAHPAALLFPPLTAQEYAGLVASVRRDGVLVPVLVDAEGLIVDGVHRARAAREVGVELPEETLPADADPWEVSLTLNVRRRHLSQEHKAAVILLAADERRNRLVKIREEAGARHGGDRRSEGSSGSRDPHEIRGRARDIIGAQIGMSGSTMARVQRIEKNHGPEAVRKIANGETTVAGIARGLRKRTNQAATPTFDSWQKAVTLLRAAAPERLEEEILSGSIYSGSLVDLTEHTKDAVEALNRLHNAGVAAAIKRQEQYEIAVRAVAEMITENGSLDAADPGTRHDG